jgi:hypothetical protein
VACSRGFGRDLRAVVFDRYSVTGADSSRTRPLLRKDSESRTPPRAKGGDAAASKHAAFATSIQQQAGYSAGDSDTYGGEDYNGEYGGDIDAYDGGLLTVTRQAGQVQAAAAFAQGYVPEMQRDYAQYPVYSGMQATATDEKGYVVSLSPPQSPPRTERTAYGAGLDTPAAFRQVASRLEERDQRAASRSGTMHAQGSYWSTQ